MRNILLHQTKQKTFLEAYQQKIQIRQALEYLLCGLTSVPHLTGHIDPRNLDVGRPFKFEGALPQKIEPLIYTQPARHLSQI